MQMSGRKRKKKNVKGRDEGNVTLIFVLDSNNCDGIKSIVSLKDSERPMV